MSRSIRDRDDTAVRSVICPIRVAISISSQVLFPRVVKLRANTALVLSSVPELPSMILFVARSHPCCHCDRLEVLRFKLPMALYA